MTKTILFSLYYVAETSASDGRIFSTGTNARFFRKSIHYPWMVL